MHSNRREFVIAASTMLTAKRAACSVKASIKAVAFDAFPILDPRPVFALTEQLFPGKGPELSSIWRTRQFEYTWLRTMSRNYSDFWSVTEDALVFAAKTLKVDLTKEKRDQLMAAYLALRCWPDVPAALRTLKNAHIRIAFLSNMTQQMLETGIRNSGLENLVDHVLSTDQVKAYKPDPRAYQMGLDAFRLKRNEVVFAAFAGWDAAGAKAFGYPTFWVNRLNQPSEELGIAPDGEGSGLNDLVGYVTG